MKLEQNFTRRLFGTDSSMGLFVSLYLVMLAFFIVLNAISNQAAVKSDAVMDSVSDTFSADNPARSPRAELEPPGSIAVPTDAVLTEIEGLFLAEFSVPGKFSADGYEVMEFNFPARFLFVDGALDVRRDRHPFLSKLAGASLATSVNYKQEMLFLFGSGEGRVAYEMTRNQELAVRRAGSLARYLRAEGLAEGTFGTGFAPIAEENIVVLIRSVPDDVSSASVAGANNG